MNGVITGSQIIKKQIIAWKDILQNVILWLLLSHSIRDNKCFLFTELCIDLQYIGLLLQLASTLNTHQTH